MNTRGGVDGLYASGPAGGALAAVAVAAASGTSAPWASQPYLFIALTLPPALLASLLAFKLLHVALKAIKGPVLERKEEEEEDDDDKKKENDSAAGSKNKKKKSAEDEKKEKDEITSPSSSKKSAEEPEDRTAAAYMSADESADWNILAGNVAFFIFVGAFLIKKSFASSYVFLLFGLMLAVMVLMIPVLRSFVRPKQGLGSLPVPTSSRDEVRSTHPARSLDSRRLSFFFFVFFFFLTGGNTTRVLYIYHTVRRWLKPSSIKFF